MVCLCHADGLQCFTALVLHALPRKQPFPSSTGFHFLLWQLGWLQHVAVGQTSCVALLLAPLAIEEENGSSNTLCHPEVIWAPSTANQDAELNQVSALGLSRSMTFAMGLCWLQCLGRCQLELEHLSKISSPCRFSAEIWPQPRCYSERLKVSPHLPVFTNYLSVFGASVPCWVWLGVSKYLVLNFWSE